MLQLSALGVGRGVAAAALACLALGEAAATTISFGANRHGLHGAATGVATSGAWHMALVAAPLGAVFHENSATTLAVDGRGVTGSIDVGDRFAPDKINILGGTGAAAGIAESITFSFDRAGVLEALLFDGVKDETLEYMRIQAPDGGVLLLFDFEAEFRLAQQGFNLTALASEPVRLFDDAGDDATGLAIPFSAGDKFVLSYGELPYPSGYVPLTPNQPPNGARWQGLVVVETPEPSAAALGGAATIVLVGARRRAAA
jgi:hypothetical protein